MVNFILVAINIIGLIVSIIGLLTIGQHIKRMNMEYNGMFKKVFYILMVVNCISLLIRGIDWIR